MSVRSRWILAAVTTVLGAAWVTCMAVGHGHAQEWMLAHEIAGNVLRAAVMVSAVSLVLGCLLSPRSALLRVGRDIGRAEQRRECACSAGVSADFGRVVPFKPTCRK